MTSTGTTSGRVARVALVAVAALASLMTGASIAQASQRGPSLPTSGPGQPASQGESQWLKAPGLRWQAIARVHQLREPPVPRYYGSEAPYAPTIRGTQPLPSYYGSTAPYIAVHFKHEDALYRTQPLPRYYGSTAPYASEASLPSAEGLRADGLRWQGLARVYEREQTGAQAASVSTGSGFNWGDAGLGVAVGIGAMLLAGAAALGFRRQSRLATH